jgi:DNA-cytosine methyltransferase
MTLRHASFFSGVGGLDLGFHRAGIATVSLSEIDPYASAVLAERFPEVPNLGDITKLNGEEIPDAEVWSGGFPCQDLSVAGKRRGFEDGTRSSLAFTYLDLVERRLPRWVVLENVPGLFSSNGGRDFGRLIREMVALGYGLSWRTLDARFFGVPQRRRRVFIVAARDEAFGGFGAERAAEVLLECEGVCGHIEASREAREETTRSTSGDASGDRGGEGDDLLNPTPQSDGVRASNGLARRVDDREEVVSTPAYEEGYADSLNARDWKGGVSNQDIGRRGWLAIVRESNFGGYAEGETGATMRSTGGNYGGGSENLVAYQTRVDEKGGSFTLNEVETANSLSALWPGDTSHRSMTLIGAIQDARDHKEKGQNGIGVSETDLAYTLTSVDRQGVALSFPSRFGSNAQVTEDVAQSFAHSSGAPAVYRKAARARNPEDSETWVEGEVANTLNGFDVGDVRTTHAIIGERGEEDELLPVGLDSHRYRCAGNGIVSSVAEWIGRRIVAVDAKYVSGAAAGYAAPEAPTQEGE